MIYSLLDLLACPYDNHFPLTLEVKELKNAEVIEAGSLICPECWHRFPIQYGIPTIMPEELLRRAGERESIDKVKEMEERDRGSLNYDLRYTAPKYKIKYRALLNELNPKIEDMILDLGAGTGVLTASFMDRCKTVVAIDFSFQSLMELKQKVKGNSVHLIHADASHLPLRKEIFDKVVSSDLLEHIPSDSLRRTVIKNVYTVLKKRGELILSAYHLNFSKRVKGVLRIGDVRGKEGYHSGGRIYYYNFTERELKELLSPFFEVKGTAGLQHELPVIHAIMGPIFPYVDTLIAALPYGRFLASEILFHCSKPPHLEKTSNPAPRVQGIHNKVWGSISLIEDEREFEGLHDEWNNLLNVSATNSIFLTHEWLFTWWRHFKEGRDLRIITVKRGEELIGIAPLMRRKLVPACFKQGGILEFIGTPFNDEADFMAHEDFFKDVLSAITRFLIKDYPLWDIINLREISGTSLTLKILNETAGENKILCSNWIRSISPFIKTGNGWNKFIKDKGSKFRNNLKRAERLAEQAGQIEYEVFKGQDITDDVIKRVFDVERRSWKEKGGTPLFNDEGNRKFFINIGKIFSTKNWVIVYILKLNGRDIAFRMCFDYKEKIWEYTTAYDRDCSKVSPGTIILKTVVKDAFDKGKREYDFLRGDEQYKKRWANDKREMWQVGIIKKGIYPMLYFYFNMKLRAVLNKSHTFVAVYDFLVNRWQKISSSKSQTLHQRGGYNLIDIHFLLSINPDDTVLLIGENELLAEGLLKVCKRVIKKTISSSLCDKGSLDLIIVNDIAKMESLNSQLSTLISLLKEEGYICLSAFNLWRGGYSYKNLKRSLINAGFKDIENYIPIPTHLNPKFILTTKERSPLIYYLSHHYERNSLYKKLLYLFIRLSSAVGVFNYIVPSYIITARKGKA